MREELTGSIIFYGLWHSETNMNTVLDELNTQSEKVTAIKKQLQFRKTVLKQDAPKELFQAGKKDPASRKYRAFPLDTLINLAREGPSVESTNREQPFLVGKRVSHTFEEGTFTENMIYVAPGYPAWYNIVNIPWGSGRVYISPPRWLQGRDTTYHGPVSSQGTRRINQGSVHRWKGLNVCLLLLQITLMMCMVAIDSQLN